MAVVPPKENPVPAALPNAEPVAAAAAGAFPPNENPLPPAAVGCAAAVPNAPVVGALVVAGCPKPGNVLVAVAVGVDPKAEIPAVLVCGCPNALIVGC